MTDGFEIVESPSASGSCSPHGHTGEHSSALGRLKKGSSARLRGKHLVSVSLNDAILLVLSSRYVCNGFFQAATFA